MIVDEMRRLLGSELLRWVSADTELHANAPIAEGPLAKLELFATQVQQLHRARGAVMPLMDGRLGTQLNRLRQEVGGALPAPPEPKDAAAAALWSLALDAYPLLLLARVLSTHGDEMPLWSPSFYGDERERRFRAAVLQDGALGTVFIGDDPNDLNVHCLVHTNTGRGGGVQLAVLLGGILRSAADLLGVRGGEATAEAFARTALDILGIWRSVAATGQVEVDAYVGLAGVALPQNSADYALPWGSFGPLTKGTLAHLVPRAWPTTVQDGEESFVAGLLLKTRFRLRAAFGPDSGDIMRDTDEVECLRERAQTLALGVLLASKDLVPISHSWITVVDPLVHALHMTWTWMSPIRHPFRPRRLSPTEAADVPEWVSAVASASDASIAVAKTRTLRAASERRDPVDGLIDAVIALESLFGALGELRFRISSAVAVLLEDGVDARRKLQKKVKKLYDLRSKVVHGQGNLSYQDAAAARTEALQLAVDCLRALYRERPELLPDRDRVTTLLLAGGQALADQPNRL